MTEPTTPRRPAYKAVAAAYEAQYADLYRDHQALLKECAAGQKENAELTARLRHAERWQTIFFLTSLAALLFNALTLAFLFRVL